MQDFWSKLFAFLESSRTAALSAMSIYFAWDLTKMQLLSVEQFMIIVVGAGGGYVVSKGVTKLYNSVPAETAEKPLVGPHSQP